MLQSQSFCNIADKYKKNKRKEISAIADASLSVEQDFARPQKQIANVLEQCYKYALCRLLY